MLPKPNFKYHENPNNIVIVPTVKITRETNKTTYYSKNFQKPCSSVTTKEVGAKNVLPEPPGLVSAGENVPFYSRNIDASGFVPNEQGMPVGNDTQKEITPSCSKYGYHQNLVDLTEFSHHNDNSDEVFYKDIIIKNLNNEEQHMNVDKNYADPETIQPSVSVRQLNDTFAIITESNNISMDNVSLTTQSKESCEWKSKYLYTDTLKKDTKLNPLNTDIAGRLTNRTEPNTSKTNICPVDTSKKGMKKFNYKIQKIKKMSDAEESKTANAIPSGLEPNIKSSNTSQDPYNFKQKYQDEGTKSSHEVVERETLPKTLKSKQNSTFLQRYLAYQRFLRNYHKDQPNKQGNCIEGKKNLNKKITIPKSKENDEVTILKSTSIIEPTKRKEKPNAIVNFNTDRKKANDESNEQLTSNSIQKEKKKEYIQKIARHEDQKQKKEDSNEKITRYLEFKNNKKEYPKDTSNVDCTNKNVETNEKINKLKYLAQKKKNEQTKEKIVKHINSLKNKQDSNKTKLLRYIGETMDTDETKKKISTRENDRRLKKIEESNEKLARYLELKKKRKDLKEKEIRSIERKINKKESNKKLKRLKQKEMKKTDKMPYYVEQKSDLTKTSKHNDKKQKDIKRLRFKRIKNFEQESEEEEEEIQSVNSRSILDKRPCSINRENTLRTINVGKNSSGDNLLSKTINDMDLRTILTRKRRKNHCYGESKRIKTSQRDNLLITVKQDVNTKPKQTNVQQTKSKTKKSKNIKLVINIVCPNSADSADSDDSNLPGEVSPHQDLSFLDDFDVDEIVDSLNVSTPIHESNISPKEYLEKNNDINKSIDTSQEKPVKNNSEHNMTTLCMKKEESIEGFISTTSSRVDEGKVEIPKREKPEIKYSKNLQTDAADTNMDVFSKKQYDDDVYEVIDITNDVENNIILVEEDTTDLVSTNQQDNIKQINKLINDLENHNETETITSKQAVREDVIYIDDDSKDKIEILNTHNAKVEIVTKKINNEEQKPNLGIIVGENNVNTNNIDDSTFIQIETMLSKITHSKMENIQLNAYSDKFIESKISVHEPQNIISAAIVENKQHNITNTEVTIKSEDIAKSNISASSPNVHSSKLPNINTTITNTNNAKEIKETTVHDKQMHTTEQQQNTSEQSDKTIKSEKISDFEQPHVITNKVVDKPVKQSDIIKTESSESQATNEPNTNELLKHSNSTHINTIIKMTKTVIEGNEESTKQNQNTTNIMSTKAEETSKAIKIPKTVIEQHKDSTKPNLKTTNVQSTKTEETSKAIEKFNTVNELKEESTKQNQNKTNIKSTKAEETSKAIKTLKTVNEQKEESTIQNQKKTNIQSTKANKTSKTGPSQIVSCEKAVSNVVSNKHNAEIEQKDESTKQNQKKTNIQSTKANKTSKTGPSQIVSCEKAVSNVVSNKHNAEIEQKDESTKQNQKKTNIQSTKANKTSKTGPSQIVSCEKAVSNVVSNKHNAEIEQKDESTKQNQKKTIIQSTKANETSKAVPSRIVFCEKTVSNVVPNKRNAEIEQKEKSTKQNQNKTNIQYTKANETSKAGPSRIVSCEKAVSNGVPNKHNAEIKTTKTPNNTQEGTGADQAIATTEVNIDPKYEPIMKGIEKRMLSCLNKQLTIASLLHKGYFSIIYKCQDVTGKAYALKILRAKVHNISIYRDNLLENLQNHVPKDNYFLLEIIDNFKSSGRLCILSDYYPKTLSEALARNKRCFHVDLVNILSRQLVAAVTTLTNNHIIHSDISPKHILLNHTNDRLKLCGFDRSNFYQNMYINPSSGTINYRAPEIILGFQADFGIDVWATALVIFEMATGTKLFEGQYNNEILFQQLCTIGPLDFDMLQQSALAHMHFTAMKFKRYFGRKQWTYVRFSGINNKLRHGLFAPYRRDWERTRTQWQITEDLDKLEMLFCLLQQMLAMDPRQRLPIYFVGASEFIENSS